MENLVTKLAVLKDLLSSIEKKVNVQNSLLTKRNISASLFSFSLSYTHTLTH